MRPRIQLLSTELIERILREAFELLMSPGVCVGSAVVDLLRTAGVEVGTPAGVSTGAATNVDSNDRVARIPEKLVRQCLASVPRDFYLYNRQGEKAVHYGGDDVHFDPGSCCVQILDPETLEARPSETRDLVRIVQVTEMLPQFAAQSTAVVCSDARLSNELSNDACNGKHATSQIGDLYRLFVVLQHSDKPVVTGSFSAAGLQGMIDLLAADSGSPEKLRLQPRAVFDVCPSPPLNWSEFGSHNLIDLARAGVPAQIVSMPLAGGTAPLTLARSATLGALAGINMISGAGMLESLACFSVEKLVIDAESIASAYRLARGIEVRSDEVRGDDVLSDKVLSDKARGEKVPSETLATAMFAQIGLSGEFLKLKETRALFRQEQHLPSTVIDRSARGSEPASDILTRARTRVDELVSKYRKPSLSEDVLRKFQAIVDREADRAGRTGVEGTEPANNVGAAPATR